jgi:hypothetical protein
MVIAALPLALIQTLGAGALPLKSVECVKSDCTNSRGLIVIRTMKTRLKRVIKRVFFPAPSPTAIPKTEYEWSIGIYDGTSPFSFGPSKEADNPVLTHHDVLDVPAAIVADPFMLRRDHTWYMFFEVMNRQTRKGEIGLASSEDGVKWAYQHIVLAEPFHLSYPYVFHWADDYYLIPESYKASSIRLYKALNFPTQWLFVTTLISGRAFSDSSIFFYNDKWWIFTETNPNFKWDTLRLYYANDLIGPWFEHPQSPIIEGDARSARPGGRVLVLKNRIIRYAQDCYPFYGTQVRAFEIMELTPTSYSEREVSDSPVLTASGAGWNESGMHHIDPHFIDDGQWIACVDGRLTREVHA